MTRNLAWVRTDCGTLLLQRNGRTMALVIRLDDRQTYAWLHYGDRSEPYDSEQEACDGLLDRLDRWQRPKDK